MATINLQLPTIGQLNSTESPKIVSDFTVLQTVINGQLDTNNLSPTAAITTGQLASPTTARRSLLLQATCHSAASSTAGNYLISVANTWVTSGVGANDVPVWMGDAGYNSQPADFQVPGKSAFCKIRGIVLGNGVSPAISVTLGLFELTGTAGTGGSFSYSFGSAIAGTTTQTAALTGASSIAQLESAQFAMPTDTGTYALGITLSSTLALNSALIISAQLYGYNA